MRNISFTDSPLEAHQMFDSVLDSVMSDGDCTHIARHGSDDAVVMSLDYYNSLMETIYLLQSPANAAHLARSIGQFRDGCVVERDLLDG
jgi:antitoxin YefM